jgi:polysaccharide chain length determinant protein (PEP-CTERM system associated)
MLPGGVLVFQRAPFPMFEQFQNALSRLRSTWRFRWPALAVTWVVALLGWTVVFLIPSQYGSEARVFVDSNTLLRPLLEGIAVTPSTANQTDLVRRLLLGRPQIQSVIEKTDLRRRVRNEREREELISKLMTDIHITGDASSRQSREVNIYTISYMDTDKRLAYAVVRTLLDSFVQQSVGANRTDSDTAQRFLRDQISAYEGRLTESEARLASFKKRNIDAMPDERGGYFERLQAEVRTLDQLQSNLTVALHERNELRGKLLGKSYPGDSGGRIAAGVIETSVDGRIKEATAHLDEMLLHYTEKYPDVVATRETLARLEEQRAAEINALRRNQGALGSPRPTTSLVAQNLQIALNQKEVETASLQLQVNDRQQRVASLREHINTLPEVEAELLRLNRDYSVTKAEYERLLQRLESARLSEAADRVDEVRFKIIDPPVQALLPAKPKRVLLLFGTLLAALGAGAGCAWLLSHLRPVFVNPKELARFKDVMVMGVVNQVISDKAQAAAGRASIALALTILLLLTSGALLALFHPAVESATRVLLSRGTAT